MRPLRDEQWKLLKDYFPHVVRIWNRGGKPHRAEMSMSKLGSPGLARTMILPKNNKKKSPRKKENCIEIKKKSKCVIRGG